MRLLNGKGIQGALQMERNSESVLAKERGFGKTVGVVGLLSLDLKWAYADHH